MIKVLRAILGAILAPEVPRSTSLDGGTEYLIVPGFGKGERGGKSNQALASVAARLKEKYPGPRIILQDDVAAAMTMPPDHVIFPNPGEYLDTYQVFKKAKEYIGKSRPSVAIVAHQDHLWRCVEVARNMGMSVRVPIYTDIPYDPESEQPWTRSRRKFLVREVPARVLYALQGKI